MDANMLAQVWADVREVLSQRYLGNTVVQWLGLLATILGSLILGRVVSFVLDRQARRLQDAERLPLLTLLLKSMAGPVRLLVLGGGLYFAGQFMELTYTVVVEREGVKVAEQSSLEDFWVRVCSTVAVLAFTWFLFRLVDVVEFFLRKWTSKTDTMLDDQLVPLIRKSLRVFVVIVAGLFIAQNIFRFEIGAMLAGLGIGGLAFALAAKDAIANLFGSVTIFADRPFHLGDRVKIQGHDGMIEEVGFRSTRLRTFDGHQVIVPNAVIANETIENVSRRPHIRRVLNVTVTYDTPPEKVARALDILREMLAARREHFHADYEPRAYFSDFNADSLNLVVYYWFVPPDWWAYLAFNDAFNLELLRRFNDEGIEFAFPTQTLYVKHDSPLRAEVRGVPGERD